MNRGNSSSRSSRSRNSRLPPASPRGSRLGLWVVRGINANSFENEANIYLWQTLIASLPIDTFIFDHRPVYDRSATWETRLLDAADRLALNIESSLRTRDIGRVVLVGYDIGGIVIKKALQYTLRDAPETAQRVALLVFFGTPHRARSLFQWREIAHNLVPGSSIGSNDTLTDVARAFDELSQATELLTGLFGVCNGSYGSYDTVSPYSASLGLPATREYRFSWPSVMNLPGHLQRDLAQALHDASGK
ncbi:hypothetical protein QBC47DRAFT_405435 [Echria macrotheca]|uniref:Uncharacterized protein n=1 Tax=Echria macrotheca TaxID=438768 RepID=A0AAJ0F2D4_9PEZI|nr:hypothetical protein QBC47DRAFT_405435 [Echria macrotheca]